jgi:hypothetical protein
MTERSGRARRGPTAPRGFLKDYVAASNDAATATEQVFINALRGAEDSLVGFISTGKLEFQGLAGSILVDLTRMSVRQTITAPLADALQSAFAGGGLFGLFHEGGIAGERPPAVRYADAAVFYHAPRYHGGGRLRPAAGRGPDPSRGAASWWCRPSGSCARRRRHASSGRSLWLSMSPPLTRAPSVRARARSRPTWRARLIGRAETR